MSEERQVEAVVIDGMMLIPETLFNQLFEVVGVLVRRSGGKVLITSPELNHTNITFMTDITPVNEGLQITSQEQNRDQFN